MRTTSVLLLAAFMTVPCLLVAKSNGLRDKAMLSNTQTLSFEPTGVIQLEPPFGDIEIEGWDRPEVEITTIRAETEKDLDDIALTAVKQGEDRLKITTELPARSMKRRFQGKENTQLRYVIKAPAQAKLVVHHDRGGVKVSNFTSDIEVTTGIGEIGLMLAAPESYTVDARVRIGDVSSDVGCTERDNVMGQQLHRSAGGPHRQLYLRVGVGDISIRKIKW